MPRYIDRYIDRCLDRHIDRYIDRYIDRHMDRHIDRYMDRYIDTYIDRYIDRYISVAILVQTVWFRENFPLWLVEMEFGPKKFPAATSWEALQLANAEPEQHYTFYDYLVQCFPSLQGSKRKILEAAFQRSELPLI